MTSTAEFLGCTRHEVVVSTCCHSCHHSQYLRWSQEAGTKEHCYFSDTVMCSIAMSFASPSGKNPGDNSRVRRNLTIRTKMTQPVIHEHETFASKRPVL